MKHVQSNTLDFSGQNIYALIPQHYNLTLFISS